MSLNANPKPNPAIDFAENPEPRCPCVLLLDTSGSMDGAPIKALNEGLFTFKATLAQDRLAARRVEVAVVDFDNNVRVAQEFITVDRFQPMKLRAKGQTFMGTALLQGISLLEARRALYHQHGVIHYRPWLFLITDGEPQGEDPALMAEAAKKIRDEEMAKRLTFYSVGVENANMAKLAEFSPRPPLKLTGLNFASLFMWLSTSMQLISHSRVSDQVPLPPVGWGSESR